MDHVLIGVQEKWRGLLLSIYIYIYTLNCHKFDYYSTGLTPGGNARKDEIKENIGSKNV